MPAELIFDARNAVGESPVWIAEEQSLYWVDIPARAMFSWSSTTQAVRRWTSPAMIGCIAPHAQGGWIAAMEDCVAHIALNEDGSMAVDPLAHAAHALPGMRFNDGRCDRQGRFRAGTMLMDMSAGRAVGALYGYSPETATLQPLVEGLIVPNGLAFSPDGRTMYLSDSHPDVQCVWAFDYDIDTGLPSNRRIFIDMKPLPGRPDGAAIDEDGCYWICANDAGLVHRFTPKGVLDKSIGLPVKKPAMCAFGGPARDMLYVTSIRPKDTDISDQPLAGGLFAMRPRVRGLPEPAFNPAIHHERTTT